MKKAAGQRVAEAIIIHMGYGKTVSYTELFSRIKGTQEQIEGAIASLIANGYTIEFEGAGSTGSEFGQRLTQKGRIAAKKLRGGR